MQGDRHEPPHAASETLGEENERVRKEEVVYCSVPENVGEIFEDKKKKKTKVKVMYKERTWSFSVSSLIGDLS